MLFKSYFQYATLLQPLVSWSATNTFTLGSSAPAVMYSSIGCGNVGGLVRKAWSKTSGPLKI